MPEPSDEALLEMFRSGDAAAFTVLFERWRGSIYNFARYMLGEEAAAEDVMQETFLAVAQAAPSYQPRGQFRTWVLRITRNRCLNRIESLRVRRQHMAAASVEALDPPANQAAPHDAMQQSEEMARVRRAIEQLPERQREALVLFAFESAGYAEIAAVLDMPVNTVKTLIHRARAEVARALAGTDEPGGALGVKG
ncbi:MAG: RNA polymerase sigma factor [Planctomycetes bacterium]|nr:RNA polymerase sigma factor [Planctomycetota bacterium]